MTIVAELSEMINLLEAQIPANPRSLKNQSLRKKLERELAKYFKSLEDAFPYTEIARLYDLYVKESIGSETKNIFDPLLATLVANLNYRLNGHLVTIYMSASAEMITWGKTKAGVPIAYEGPPIEQAIEWAEKQGARLVTQMDEETRRRLAKTISDGIVNKRGIPGLARDIKKEFADMSRYRSQLIARTETSNALSQASLDRMKDMGIEGKEWVTAGDDRVSDECLGNEADGIIPVGQAFSGGVMAPPQHPDCRCTIAPARLPK